MNARTATMLKVAEIRVLYADTDQMGVVNNGNYLRWPIAGGEVDESGNRKKWTTYGSVRPVAESVQ
jgi:hypothetical protein